MTTQKGILLMALEDEGGWVEGFRLRGVATPYGFTGHSADRRLRELAEDGRIDSRTNSKGFAEYRITTRPAFPKALDDAAFEAAL